jgi:hypothetical protein
VGNSSEATSAAGDPTGNLGRTVWYRWTTTAASRLRVDTCGSEFDTVVILLDSSRTEIGRDDDACGGGQSSFQPASARPAGIYYVVVASFGSTPGGHYSLRAGRVNDDLAGAQRLASALPTAPGMDTTDATIEPGEPRATNNTGGSVWFSWVAPSSATVTINTCGSSGTSADTAIGVFTGGAMSTLHQVASNDDDPTCAQPLRSRVQFEAVAGTAYLVRVAAWRPEHAGTFPLGLVVGTDRSVPASATTGIADNVRASSATLHGSVTTPPAGTTYRFEWGATPSYDSASPPADASAGDFSLPVTGLTRDVLYHYRIVAFLPDGSVVQGADRTFVALGAPPIATTDEESRIGQTGARIAGTVNPNDLPTTYYFEFGPTAEYGSQRPETPESAGSDNAPHRFTFDVSGLVPGREYHYRIVAVNAAGTTLGSDESFTTTRPPPVATTGVADEVTHQGARLKGRVNPSGHATTYHFEYSKNDVSYGSRIPLADAGPFSDSADHDVTADLAGLDAGSVYHYRIVAVNPSGTTAGGDATFTTLAPPPVATTDAADQVTRDAARLRGTVNPNGLATTYYFEFGTTTAYGTQQPTAPAAAGADGAAHAFTTGLEGLIAGTTYHYRIVAANSSGTAFGADATFATDPPPLPSASLNTPIGGGTAGSQLPEPASGVAPGSDTPAVVTVAIARLKLARFLKRGLKASIACNEACALEASLTTGRNKKLGAAKATLPRAGKKALTIKPSARIKRSLARKRLLKVTLTVRAVDAGGNVTTSVKKLSLKR